MNNEKNIHGKKNAWIFLLLFFALTTASLILSLLCIQNASLPFLKNRVTIFTVFCGIFFFVACGGCVWCVLAGKDRLMKGSIIAYLLVVFCLSLILIFQKSGFFEVVNDSEKLQAYIESAGAFMPVMYIVLQFLQVVLLPIPSIVSTLAGLALFGAFKTMIFSLIGMIPASLLAFLIGKKLGVKAVSWIVGKETLCKWKKKLKGRDNLFLTAMFLLPLFPDDLLCFFAGLSTMRFSYFLFMIIIARTIAVGATCYSVDLIPFTTWWGLTIWGVFLLSVSLCIFFVYKCMNKSAKSGKKKGEKTEKRKIIYSKN